MSRWRPERRGAGPRRFIGLDSGQIAWCEGSDGVVQQAPIGQVGDRLATLPAAARTVDVIVGLRVAVHWLLTPPPGLRSLEELQQLARLQCAQGFGGTAESWQVAGDWQASRPFVCIGLPRAQMDALLAASAGTGNVAGQRWRWHTPWSLAERGPGAERPGWHALRSPQRLLLWRRERRGPRALLTIPVAPDDGQAEVEALARQYAARWQALHADGAEPPMQWRTDAGVAPDAAADEALFALRQRHALT